MRVDVRVGPNATVEPTAAVELLHVVSEVVDHVTAIHPGARIEVSSRTEAPGGRRRGGPHGQHHPLRPVGQARHGRGGADRATLAQRARPAHAAAGTTGFGRADGHHPLPGPCREHPGAGLRPAAAQQPRRAARPVGHGRADVRVGPVRGARPHVPAGTGRHARPRPTASTSGTPRPTVRIPAASRPTATPTTTRPRRPRRACPSTRSASAGPRRVLRPTPCSPSCPRRAPSRRWPIPSRSARRTTTSAARARPRSPSRRCRRGSRSRSRRRTPTAGPTRAATPTRSTSSSGR